MPHFLHLLLHPIKVLWQERISLFWPFWFATTAFGVVMVIWVVPQRKYIPLDSRPSRSHEWSRAAILAVAFLCLFLACYIAGTLVWEDFTYADNSMFTLGTLVGQNIPLPIWPGSGRFFPLGHQEYNLLRHVTSSVTGYHALRIVQLVLLSGMLLLFDEQLSIRARVALIILVLITPSILISFSGLIYPESNVIFWLLCLAWSVKRFESTRSMAWAVAAVICSQLMLYYKETAFLLLFGFAIGRLLLRCWNGDRAGWDCKRLRDPESRLDMCLALLVAPFLLFYLAAMFPNYGMSYAELNQLPWAQVLDAYLKVDLLAGVFVAVVLARFFLFLRGKVAPSLLWDGLALGGIACAVGYLILGIHSAYYLAPVDLIAVLYLGRLTVLSLDNMRLGTRLGILVLLTLVLLQDLSLSAFRMYERKNVIHSKVELGRAIEARYKSSPQNAKRLFFPFTRPYRIMEFAAYLNYLGVPAEQAPAGSVATRNVLMVGTAIEKDGLCVVDRPFVCHPGGSPDPGDLVVVLPDDSTPDDELNLYRQEGTEPFFSYHPRPSISPSLRPYVNRLHVVSYAFFREPLPARWPTASATVWK
jgi:hypothetical protein